MNPDLVIEIGTNAIGMVLIVSMPILATALVVGVLISLFQAVTQIQEMTLTFVPKIVAVFLVMILSAPWAIEKVVDFTRSLFLMIPNIVS